MSSIRGVKCWRLDHGREQSGLLYQQIFRRFLKIEGGRGSNTIGILTPWNLIKIKLLLDYLLKITY